MVSLFKDRSAVSIFWLIIVCFGLHVHSLVHPPQIITVPADGFFYYVLKPLLHVTPYFVSLLFVIYIFLLALQLNFVLNDLRMLPKQSYTPALAFILFSAQLPAFNAVTAALLSCNFFIWILYAACRLYAAPNAKTSIYNLGLLTGACVLLYFPSAPLIIIVIIALAIIRPFNINEWFVLFFGITTPAYLLGAYLFLTDQFKLFPLSQQVFGLLKLPAQPLLSIITLSVAATAVVWGIFTVQNTGGNVLIQVRKSWSVFLTATIFIVPVIFFIEGAFPVVLLLAFIPAACYTGFAFATVRNILPAIVFWVLIALSIYNNWFAKY